MKNPLTSVQTEVKNYILKQGLLSAGESVLLAVSGGADSIAMLGIMNTLAGALGIRIAVAHFDHNTREGASTDEARMVEALCERLQLPFYGGRAAEGAFDKGNFEALAREARYGFLREIAAKESFDYIATAHHKEDAAETLLMHLLRGCGLEGLGGIAPKERAIIRPILCLSRQDTESYCEAAGLSYACDCSNDDTDYLRNRLRLHIIPQLKEINPQLTEALCHTADICRGENTAMSEWAAYEYDKLVDEQGLDMQGIARLPYAVATRVLRLYCEKCMDIIIGAAQTESLFDIGQNSIVALTGCYAYMRGDKLLLSKKSPEKPVKNAVNNQFIIGCYDLNADFRCEVTEAIYEGINAENMLWLPVGVGELHWRSRKPQDKIALKGMKGHKSVKAIMNEAALPIDERDFLPLLVQGDLVLWLPFVRKAVYELPQVGEKALKIQIYRK